MLEYHELKTRAGITEAYVILGDAFLDGLAKPEQRQIVEHIIAGRSFEEVASRMEWPTHAVARKAYTVFCSIPRLMAERELVNAE